MLAVACEGVREGATHGDDTVWSRHLQLEVGVVGDCHESCVAWSPQDGLVGPCVVEPPKLLGPHAPVTVQRPLTTMHMFQVT